MNEELPIGLDYAWIGSDAAGCVARFTNGGEGPIPAVILADREAADRVEDLICSLPIVGEHEIRVLFPDPSSYIDIARRGLFAYDWIDATRTSGDLACYEIVSRPTRPVRIGDLPPELRQLAASVRFGDLLFATSDSIRVDVLADCICRRHHT